MRWPSTCARSCVMCCAVTSTLTCAAWRTTCWPTRPTTPKPPPCSFRRMFHVEMRMGMQVVREFNLSNERLWSTFLEPLMADRDFSIEGHDYSPRHTRLKVYEGPELRID